MARRTILDLFAGAGGWEEGLHALRLKALGVENEQWACRTARAAGHTRLQADVAVLDPRDFAPVWGLIASPPCQAYSTAGKGLGRLDKPHVVACAQEIAAGHDSRAEHSRECRDPRSLLTVEPLRYAVALRPRWIALEQVPAVLELWTLFAQLLAAYGYDTTAGVLSAERYGVPKTRKRAFLIASLDGAVQLPAPTHRSYDARRKETPENELGLLPWVSMAEALGWGMTARPGLTVVAGYKDGGSKSRECVRRERDSGAWVEERPAPTLVTTRRSKDGALVGRQLPPGEGCERGGWAWRNGNQQNSSLRNASEPAPTVHFGHRANRVEWVPDSYDSRQTGTHPRPIERPAPTMLANGLAKGVPVWSKRRPATTVACDRRVHPPGHKHNASDPPGRYQPRRGTNAVRVTVSQAAILQGFRPDYPWQGSRTRQFEQVGNAVPPPLARHVLKAAVKPSRRLRRSNGRPPSSYAEACKAA
jgi:DNA (cytosine-5)-methyltransferase 1